MAGGKKTGSKKKSVTWKDVNYLRGANDSESSVLDSLNIPKAKYQNITPKVKYNIYNIPFHNIGIIYFLLYVEYQQLIKYETINSVLLKALPLTYFGQIAWLWMLQISPITPASSTNVSEKKKSSSTVSSKHKKPSAVLNISHILAATFVSVLSTFLIYFIAVLLGSPILAFQSQTLLFSLHLSFLAIFPLVVVYQFNKSHWISLVVMISDYKFLFTNPIYLVALGSLAGGWSGVLTIPLDWDRDWQLYPISLVIGSYIGGLVGGLVAFLGSFIPV